jgi:gliding motility-associated GldM-like protein
MRILQIILAVFLLVSCKNNIDISNKINSMLKVTDSDNKIYMRKLEQGYVWNPVKAGPFYEKAKHINQLSDRIHAKVSDKSSCDTELLKEIKNFFEIVLSFYWENETLELKSMSDKIALFESSYLHGERLVNETKLFLKYDLNIIRNEIVRHLYTKIDKNDFKFNYIEPVVLANKKVLKLGEIYSAKIIVAAYDTTVIPNYSVNGELLDWFNGDGIYKVKTNKKGSFEWNGIMKYYNPASGQYDEFPFSSSYVVK